MPGTSSLASSSYTLTSSTKRYTPGQSLSLTLNGAPFRGILLYVTDSKNPGHKTGSFAIPSKFQNNAAVCVNSDAPTSSITHTKQSSDYAGSQTFTYTPSSSGSTGDLLVNVIIMQTSGGFKSFVGENILTIPKNVGTTSSGGSGTGSSAPSGKGTGVVVGTGNKNETAKPYTTINVISGASSVYVPLSIFTFIMSAVTVLFGY
jgi:hypothetical protein